VITLAISRDDMILDRPADLRALVWMAAKAESQGGREIQLPMRGLAKEMEIGTGAAQSILRRLNREGYIDINSGRGRTPSVVTVRTTKPMEAGRRWR